MTDRTKRCANCEADLGADDGDGDGGLCDACACGRDYEELAKETARLRAGLEMLAQLRHVSGSAQGAFRSNLGIVDAVLAGADVRDLATAEAIAAGRWKPPARTV